MAAAFTSAIMSTPSCALEYNVHAFNAVPGGQRERKCVPWSFVQSVTQEQEVIDSSSHGEKRVTPGDQQDQEGEGDGSEHPDGQGVGFHVVDGDEGPKPGLTVVATAERRLGSTPLLSKASCTTRSMLSLWSCWATVGMMPPVLRRSGGKKGDKDESEISKEKISLI
ncbi:hypothetical protein EYF80_041665 [Liparis tanakae]|uniref:Uncharacterized protein n=1 Tax=Liparis tanakae TaxID=230148 RepID=A0A4Z2G3K1_9TELE|nr:hypothetical protein EYF80_041665 [Liparis tanakae]